MLDILSLSFLQKVCQWLGVKESVEVMKVGAGDTEMYICCPVLQGWG